MSIKTTKASETSSPYKAALEHSSACIMMCDTRQTIIYVNAALQQMFSTHQAQMSRSFPGFDPSDLLGKSLNLFYQDPARFGDELQTAARMPLQSNMQLGDISFRLRIGMLNDSTGDYQGNIVEWHDETMFRTFERELEIVSQAASMGDLQVRGQLSNLGGNCYTMMSQVNEILEHCVTPTSSPSWPPRPGRKRRPDCLHRVR